MRSCGNTRSTPKASLKPGTDESNGSHDRVANVGNVRSLTILHTESSLGLGGQEFRILNECVGMQALGHKIFLVVQPESQLMKRAHDAGLTCLPLRMSRSRWGTLIFSLLKIIKQYDIDVISTHGSIDSWTASIAGRLSRHSPLIIRNRHKSVPISNTLRHRMLYGKLPHAVVTTGEQLRRDLVENNGLAESRVVSIPTGVDLSIFYPRRPDVELKESLGLNSEERVVGTIAFLREYKGVGDFLQAAKTVYEKRQDVKFLIVGEGPEKRMVSQMIQDLALQSCVFLLGFREDIPSLLSIVDVLVLSSLKAEGVPQVLTQALAMERGVVATHVGSIQEIVRHRETGLLVKPGKPEELAWAIEEILHDGPLRKKLGQAGRELMVREYGLPSMLHKTMQLYEMLLNGRGPVAKCA